MISGFLTVFSHISENECGEQKEVKVEEFYEAYTFTEAESYINKLHKDKIHDGFYVVSMQRASFEEIKFIENEEQSDDSELNSWYKVIIKYLLEYSASGKAKYSNLTLLIRAKSSEESINTVNSLEISDLIDFEIVSTSKTKISKVHLI